MAKPSPKQSFLQTALLMITIYLGITLFMRSQTQPTTVDGKVLTSPADVLVQMRDANAKILDHTISSQLQPALNKEVDKQEKLSQSEKDALKIEGAILTADTQLKAGILRNETTRIRTAYQTLANFEKRLLDKPEWTKSFKLPRLDRDDSRFDWKEASGHSLYAKVVDILTARNQKELIWGFIPGGYQAIDFLVHLTGARPEWSYAFAAFLLALVVRAIVFPLAQKQLMWGRQMSQLGPLTGEIREKYKDEPALMNQKVMELYKEYGINPMAGCGPALLQFPLFLTVYQCMLLYQFEFQKGYFLWINPATSKATNGLVAPNLGTIDYILIVLYGISMLVTTLLTPVSDPSQLKQQRLIGVFFAIFVTVTMFTGAFPVPGAFVLYWLFTNILATAQSLRAYRLPMPPLVKINAPGGGVFPTAPASGGNFWQRALDQARQSQGGSPKSNGVAKTNGAAPSTNGATPKFESNSPPKKTGAPAKHKPKKRK